MTIWKMIIIFFQKSNSSLNNLLFAVNFIQATKMGNEVCVKEGDFCCGEQSGTNKYRQRSQSEMGSRLMLSAKSSKISDEYIILHPAIGKGSFGCVYKSVNRSTNIMRAVKRILKKNKNSAGLQEILILKKLDHPNIIRIHDIYIEQPFIYIVMEYCSGGQLFQRIVEQQTITQNEAKIYMKQLLSAMTNCHSNKIMHRDLKPQNIMFASKDSNQLKIIDFGAGTCYRDDATETLKIGSIYYIAPQVIKKNYNQKCDIWSLGVILYIMLSGTPPFNGKTDKIIYDKILNAKVNFPQKKWSRVSLQARQLITKMLEYDPQKRISARQALLSPWILSATKEGDQNLYISNEMQAMKQFSKVNKFQSAVISFISYNLVQSRSLNKLQNVFKQIDANHDGKISWKEFKSCYLENMPPTSEEQLIQMFKKLDQNSSGFIDYTEFIASALHKNYEENQHLLEKAFNIIDKDGDGYLDIEQLQISFGNTDRQIAEQMLKQADLNGDRKISREQFKYAMRNITLKSKTENFATRATKNQ